jgi:hypothetical protein
MGYYTRAFHDPVAVDLASINCGIIVLFLHTAGLILLSP